MSEKKNTTLKPEHIETVLSRKQKTLQRYYDPKLSAVRDRLAASTIRLKVVNADRREK